tara:strand:+ start:191 stop:1549 length:1359 start_codon:yes stop_codon:yes gene_type:complete
MKKIAAINAKLPADIDEVKFFSSTSLLDYDIIVVNPAFPYMNRIDFSGGGSCISIESGQSLVKAIRHWRQELDDALTAGKTIFVLLNSQKQDSYATGYTTPRKGSTNYSTSSIDNYSMLPFSLTVRNATGSQIKTTDSRFSNLLDTVKDQSEFRVIVTSKLASNLFSPKSADGVLGGILRKNGISGRTVLLPYFDLSQMYEEIDGHYEWTKEATSKGQRLIGELVAIDKALTSENAETPKPAWLESIQKSALAARIVSNITLVETDILRLQAKRKSLVSDLFEAERYSALLYENGKALEAVVEDSLKLFGYKVENFATGDIEIDHIIVGPSGLRMIGETEGKDTAAISIAKFRQLETNINEDFSREDVKAPAKGVLFGNGERLIDPKERQIGFTDKCLTNAKRLGTVLVNTKDLYPAVAYLLDNPDDEEFKKAVRDSLENTVGQVASFPNGT